MKVPQILPRLLEVEPSRFVLLDQVIEANLDALFSGMEVEEHHLFRVTRNADFEIEEDEADDLLLAIEEELRRRRFGAAVRLEVERSMPAATRALLLRGLGLGEADCYEVSGMLDLTGLWAIADLDRPDLKPVPWSPVTPPRLIPPDEDEPADVFAAIRAGDILVHHPYESFAASTERFITQAANDPDVLTIKQTLYRTSGDSPIVQSLIRAAERGKQVVVLVEIKARFDEEANIVWARKLERAGAHVVYGLVGLKTHSKTALVVRREGSGLRRYVHIGTGNYNPKTARLYVDLGLLTCRPEIGADVTDLFNNLTGLSRQRTFRRLLVAPHSLRPRFLDLVDREVGHAASGRPARIVLKLNAIVDVAVIEALYRASNAGVSIDLIIRGACSIQPGLPGVSENIRVRSIIGEFLEHSRIWSFDNGGEREWYIGSADLMDRNLDRRVEAVAPVEDFDAQAPAGPDHRCDARRRPAFMAAQAGRHLGPDGDPRGTRGHDRHVRGAQGGCTRPRQRRDDPAPTGRGRRLAGPARVSAAVERPVEVELKYRVVDLAAAERYLVAEEIGSFSGTAAPRSSQFEDRYVDTADGAMTRAGFAVRSAADRAGHGRVGQVARADGRAGRLGPARGARGPGRPDGRAARLARIGRPVARPRAGRRRPAGGARDHPPAATQAHRPRRRHAGRAEPRRGRRRVALTGRRPVRRARGRAGQGRRGAAGRRWPRSSPRIRPWRPPAAASSRPRWPPSRTGSRRRRDGSATGVAKPTTLSGPRRRRATHRRRRGRSRVRRAASRVRRARADRRRRRRRRTSSTRRSRRREPATRASSSARPRASPPTTTSPRPAARSCASTSPGCSRARPARARASDPEDLHAMRVATRRQRAAWRVFGASFRPARTKRYRNGLREIASRLGAVRDLDVLLEAADLYRADLPVTEQRALEPLLTDWREHRDDARVLLIRELDSDGYRRWVDDYRDFVRTEGAAVVPVAADPAAPRPRHRRHPGSGPPTSRCAATSRSCAGPTSRRSTSCGSPASGCATRSSSCARRSATMRRR